MTVEDAETCELCGRRLSKYSTRYTYDYGNGNTKRVCMECFYKEVDRINNNKNKGGYSMTVEEAQNRGCVKNPNNQACIANWCMGWRWCCSSPSYSTDASVKREGYCGLAGREGAE